MKKLIFLLSLISIISCQNSSKQQNSTKAQNDEYISSEWVTIQKKKSLEEGNFRAFGNLVDYYGNNPSKEYEMLPIAIIMADKYNCDNARVAIYFWFLEMQNEGRDEKQFFKLDKSKQDFILKYLMDGAKNRNVGCLGILVRLIENGLEIDKNKVVEIKEAYKKATAKSGLQ